MLGWCAGAFQWVGELCGPPIASGDLPDVGAVLEELPDQPVGDPLGQQFVPKAHEVQRGQIPHPPPPQWAFCHLRQPPMSILWGSRLEQPVNPLGERVAPLPKLAGSHHPHLVQPRLSFLSGAEAGGLLGQALDLQASFIFLPPLSDIRKNGDSAFPFAGGGNQIPLSLGGRDALCKALRVSISPFCPRRKPAAASRIHSNRLMPWGASGKRLRFSSRSLR